MQAWNQQQTEDSLKKIGVEWHVNAPYASHHGGCWKRLIRSVKKVLCDLSPRQPYTDESLLSHFAEVETIVNSRPLTPVTFSEVVDKPLNPNDLLLMNAPVTISPPPNANDSCSKKPRLQMKHLSNIFWQRLVKEYLPLIMRRTKWLDKKRNLQIGDVVLAIDENTPKSVWPLGLIENTYPDKHGHVRTVMVRINNNLVKRPITILSLLEPVRG